MKTYSRSADFQSAVSQVSNLLDTAAPKALEFPNVRAKRASADWKSAIQQTGSLRYGRRVFSIVLGVALAVLLGQISVSAEDSAKEPLALKLPQPAPKGTPANLPSGANLEPLSDKARPAFLVPKGVTNAALGKPVASSTSPFNGTLAQITDGLKEPDDAQAVEFKKGTQWVQVDLGQPWAIHAIVVWHDHRAIQVFHDVIVQVSDDPGFKTGVTTLYNNDADNSSGLGAGSDKEYFETRFGRVIDARGVAARYVRSYTRGSTQSPLNAHQEIEVYALPAPGK